MGDLAEMSYMNGQAQPLQLIHRLCNPEALTNDLLYESNDSREIEKASISELLSHVPVEVPEGLDRRGQKLFFSGGEG